LTLHFLSILKTIIFSDNYYSQISIEFLSRAFPFIHSGIKPLDCKHERIERSLWRDERGEGMILREMMYPCLRTVKRCSGKETC